MPAAAAVPIALAVMSAISSSKGAKAQKKAAQTAAANAERARGEAKQAISPQAISGIADWLFPGMLPSRTGAFGGGGTGTGDSMGGAVPYGGMTPYSTSGAADYFLRTVGRRRAMGAAGAQYGIGTASDRYGVTPNITDPGMNAAGSIPSGAPGSPTSPVSTAMTPGTPPPPSSLAPIVGAFQARAEGGPVSPDRPYLVGEEGPEVITPSKEGTVIPADETAAMGFGSSPFAGEGEEGVDPEQALLKVIVLLLTKLLENQGAAGGGMEAMSPMAAMGGPGPGMGAPPMESAGPQGIPMRAEGGPVAAGEPVLVGEQGPEAVVPEGPTLAAGVQGGPSGTVATSSPGSIRMGRPGRTGTLSPRLPAPQEPQLGGPLNPGARGIPVGFEGSTGTPGSTTVLPGTGDAGTYPGGLVTQRVTEQLANPGQLSPAAYERQQEQSNQQLRAAGSAITGSLAGGGVDPSSALGGALRQSAVAAAGKQRSEAARDYTLAQETLRRQDIAAATSQYIQSLQAIFGLAQQQAAAAGGSQFPQVAPINTYQPISDFFGTLGSQLASRSSSGQSAKVGSGGFGTAVPNSPSDPMAGYVIR